MREIISTSETRVQVPEYGAHLQIDQLKEIVRRSGSHFFDPDTMRYFRSRVDSYCVAGRDGWYFVTSEQQSPTPYSTHVQHYPRLYTVRCLRLEGYDGKEGIELYELGGFQAFKTLGRARTAAKHAAKVGAKVCPKCHLRLMREAETVCEECGERAARRARA